MESKDSVFRSLELIESHITGKMTVENIASGIYFSKNHYQRLFREIVGESVMEYVTKRKLSLAGRALLETDASILDIAMDYGYDSRDGFTRSFKSYMGVTPTEYRKYGLAVITRKTVKERANMSYSKTTDGILRELNDFIAKAKETAEAARKCELPLYREFWCSIADKTDAFTDNIQRTLTRISDISDNPDRITSHFNIIKAIDDTAFQMHVTAFHAGLTIARAKLEDSRAMQPLCGRYRDLVNTLNRKTLKTAQLFNELSALIFEDMRKTLTAKMEEVIQRARAAADMIVGYGYIKNEFMNMAEKLTTVLAEGMDARLINDVLFKLPTLQIAIDTDIIRSGGRDKAMFDGIEPLKQSLEETIDFVNTLPEPKAEEPAIVRVAKMIDDIGYQSNILLFFTRGEVEKLGGLLSDAQKAAFDKICVDINHYIHVTHTSADRTAFRPVADRVCSINEDMAALADELGECGGAIKYISDSFGQLYDKVVECIKSIEP